MFAMNTGRNVDEYPVRLAQLRARQGKERIWGLGVIDVLRMTVSDHKFRHPRWVL
jgi:hypothetical protein